MRNSERARFSAILTLAALAVCSPSQPQAVRAEDLQPVQVAIPEILVIGGKPSLNMDIQRTRDDAQPYTVFERATIERSGARNLEEFLKTRLNANAAAASYEQFALGFSGNLSNINLRGLGSNQTLILIDGHRRASAISRVDSSTPGQPDINGIPLSAIERIEVLPTTASGIHGGGATGGVINIVMRRDYRGTEVNLSYGGTFAGGAAARHVDLSHGLTLEGGKSTVSLVASYTDANPLLIGDRRFTERGRATVLANSPQFYTAATNPPLGATTNIRNAGNGPLVLDNGTVLGSSITSIPYGYAGVAADGVAPLLANLGSYNLDVADTPQVLAGGKRVALLNGSRIKSLATTLRRDFGARAKGFLDLGYSDNLAVAPRSAFNGVYTIQANAPNNPFNHPVRVTTPIFTDREYEIDLRNYHGVGGVIVTLPAGWQASMDYTWNRVRQTGVGDFTVSAIPGPDATAVGNGTVDVLRDTNLYEADLSALLNALSDFGPRKTTFEETALRAAGPLLWLPGGALTLSTLISHRQERIAEATARTPGFTQLFPGRSQSVNSAYVELRTPLVAAQNRIRGVEELELQLAVRRDEYQVNGATTFILSNNPSPLERAANELSSTDPTLAIRYRPLRDAMFRASCGTGFLPPGVEQLVPTAALPITAQLRDPRRGNELATGVTGFGGGNPDLQPEDSRSWSAGLVLTPRGVPGLRASLDWSRIEKTNNIVSFGPATQALMDRENLFPSRFIRAAPAPGDPFGVGRLIQLDLTSINLAQAEVEAWDAAIDYAPQTERYGTFDLFSTLTWLAHFKTKALPTEPFVDSVGIGSSLVSLSTGSPLRLRASGGVTWSRRGLNLTWQSQYFHHYIASTNAATLLMQGNAGRVPSQVYHDVSATYSFASAAGLAWLANTRLQLGLQNVFNRQPPVDVNFQNTFYSPFGDPRLRSYSLSIRHGF